MLHRVKNKRNLKRVKRTFWPRPAVLAASLLRHIKRHPLIYAPLAGPVLLVLLAHMIAVPAHILLKSSAHGEAMAIVDAMLTWSVYGFLPLLLLSYASFHAVARPVVRILRQHWESAPPVAFNMLPGTAQGAIAGMGFLILLRPGSELAELVLFGICLLIGMLNWFVYRRLCPEDANQTDMVMDSPEQ